MLERIARWLRAQKLRDTPPELDLATPHDFVQRLHSEHDALVRALESASSAFRQHDLGSAATCWTRFVRMLRAHARFKDVHVYRALAGGYGEDAEISAVIAGLRLEFGRIEPLLRTFDAKCRVLTELEGAALPARSEWEHWIRMAQWELEREELLLFPILDEWIAVKKDA
jgi:hypothetical protein